MDLVDQRVLADFLGRTPLADVLTSVAMQFALYLERFPVLNDVMQRWSQLRTVRTLTPASVQDWVDAVTVIDSASNVLADASR